MVIPRKNLDFLLGDWILNPLMMRAISNIISKLMLHILYSYMLKIPRLVLLTTESRWSVSLTQYQQSIDRIIS